MSVRLTTMPELNRKAFDILQRELGLPDTLRFFSHLGLGAGNVEFLVHLIHGRPGPAGVGIDVDSDRDAAVAAAVAEVVGD